MNRLAVAAAATLLFASTAAAQTAAPDIQQWKPTTDVDGFILVHDATLLPQLRWGVGLSLNYAVNPLEVQAPGYGRQFGLVDGLLGGDLTGALSLFDWWDVGLRFPLLQIPIETDFVDSPAFPGRKVAYGIGDLHIESRIRILDAGEKPVGLALNPFLTLPTGTRAIGLGRGLPGTGVRLIASQRYRRIHFALNAGFAFFGRATVANLTTGNEFTYGLGFGVIPIVDHLEINLELDGSLIAGPNERDAQERFFNSVHSPAELVLSARGSLNNGLTIHGGVGKGLSNGYGTPDFRAFAGVGWAIRTPRDRDKDGLHDKIDGCVSEPEDVDGFQDEDGCPDPDNDADGVLDAADGCPDVAEDADSWEDGDGCPDPDNDADGVLDDADTCRDVPEDRDGWQDDDGCPDPDDDADGVTDSVDTCPRAPEDVDGWKDEDGCPEADNDSDGLMDPDDLCPNEPEDLNGIKDGDGCPDSKLAVRRNDAILILEKVYFATNKDTVLKRSAPLLAAVAEVLAQSPEILMLRVEGHTDDVGADKANLDLSQRRSDSIVRELAKLKIDKKRLEAVGYGETRPLDTNRTEDGRERNRRVEFTILVLDGGSAAPPAESLWGAPSSPPPAQAPTAPAAPESGLTRPTPAPPKPLDPGDIWGVPSKPAAETKSRDESEAPAADEARPAPGPIWGE